MICFFGRIRTGVGATDRLRVRGEHGDTQVTAAEWQKKSDMKKGVKLTSSGEESKSCKTAKRWFKDFRVGQSHDERIDLGKLAATVGHTKVGS